MRNRDEQTLILPRQDKVNDIIRSCQYYPFDPAQQRMLTRHVFQVDTESTAFRHDKVTVIIKNVVHPSGRGIQLENDRLTTT